MKTTIRYVILCALHDRLFYGLMALVLAVAGISYFLGNTAFLEHTQMMAAFTAGASRIILVLTAIVFVCFYIKSSFDNKHMDVLLSRPITRDAVVVAHWMGFAFVAIFMVAPVCALLLLVDGINLTGLLWWTFTMVLELWVVVAFALFASLIMKSAVVSVLSALAFYVLARMMVLFVMTAERSMGSLNVPLLPEMLNYLSYIFPRIDLFSKSEWLVHGMGVQFDLGMIVVQTVVYISMLLLMCMIDFRRKQF